MLKMASSTFCSFPEHFVSMFQKASQVLSDNNLHFSPSVANKIIFLSI